MGKTFAPVSGLPATALFVAMPMMGAAVGAVLDERTQLGFTTWRSACRAAGLRLGPVFDFTLQLLPMAVIGLLIGGLILIFSGVWLRRQAEADLCTAAHVGCALSLPLGLMLCASPLPLPLMLVVDLLLATSAATGLLWLMRRRSHRPPANK